MSSVMQWKSINIANGVASVTQLEGYDILPVRPDLSQATGERFTRNGTLLESVTGPREFDDHAGVPLPTRSFLWSCPDRAACELLRAFLDARHGRVVPFWAPTFNHDLEMVQDGSSNIRWIWVRRAGYVEKVYPLPGRNRIAIFPPGGEMFLRPVLAAFQFDATTDTVLFDPVLRTTGGPIFPLPKGSTCVSFLTLCRLAEDMTKITWFSNTSCQASLQFIELPHEVPPVASY